MDATKMFMTERIRALAEDKDLTFASLERKAKLANSSIRYWDTSPPSVDKVIRIAEILETTVEWLYYGKHNGIEISKNDIINSEEAKLLDAFRKLNKIDKIRILEKTETIAEITEREKTKKSTISRKESQKNSNAI